MSVRRLKCLSLISVAFAFSFSAFPFTLSSSSFISASAVSSSVKISSTKFSSSVGSGRRRDALAHFLSSQCLFYSVNKKKPICSLTDLLSTAKTGLGQEFKVLAILSQILLLCDEPFLVLYGFSKTTSLHNSKSFCYVESL